VAYASERGLCLLALFAHDNENKTPKPTNINFQWSLLRHKYLHIKDKTERFSSTFPRGKRKEEAVLKTVLDVELYSP